KPVLARHRRPPGLVPLRDQEVRGIRGDTHPARPRTAESLTPPPRRASLLPCPGDVEDALARVPQAEALYATRHGPPQAPELVRPFRHEADERAHVAGVAVEPLHPREPVVVRENT